jgi:preprotein translocase subunit SecG
MSVMLVLAALPTWSIGLLVALFFFVCILLILTILIQRPQGGGLSGAFGSGAGSGQTAFGAKTGDALTIATIGMFVVYVLAAIGLNYAIRPGEAVAGGPAQAASTDASTAAPQPTVVPPAEPAPVVPITPPTVETVGTAPPPGLPAPGPAPSPGPGQPAPVPAVPAPAPAEPASPEPAEPAPVAPSPSEPPKPQP